MIESTFQYFLIILKYFLLRWNIYFSDAEVFIIQIKQKQHLKKYIKYNVTLCH